MTEKITDYGALCYDNDAELTYSYKGITYKLTSYPYEPCMYLKRDDSLICVLHNAFTTYYIAETFSSGKKAKIYRWEYDEKEFCQILATVLESGRSDLDFTYAAKLWQEGGSGKSPSGTKNKTRSPDSRKSGKHSAVPK
ncbi:hypothetical protein [Succinimonas sp.]|uniref:hypothetical protein n=1 Tax=Succinimonas sp. TaxID=1936151 RepID=UPI00386C8E39